MSGDTDLEARIRAMSDDELLAEINAHDPYDAEFARRFRAMRDECDRLKGLLLPIELLTAAGEGLTPEDEMHVHLLAAEGRANDPAAIW